MTIFNVIHLGYLFFKMKNKIHNLINQVFPKIDDYDSEDLTWDPRPHGGTFSVMLSYKLTELARQVLIEGCLTLLCWYTN